MISVEFILQGKIGEQGTPLAERELPQVPAQWQYARFGDGHLYRVIAVYWDYTDGLTSATVYVERCEQTGSAVKREGSGSE